MAKLKAILNPHKKTFLTLFLILVFIWSLLSVNWGPDLFHPGGINTMKQIFKSLLHPSISREILISAVIATWRTLAYAVAGMTLAVILGFCLGIPASGIFASSKRSRAAAKGFFRGILALMRSVHELVWVWLFVAATGLNPYAAIFALAIPYGGTLGRIYADIFSDVPKDAILSLKSSGASKLQLLVYGYLPMARLDLISYTMYRFECAVRSSTIMSFVGLGGLGYQIYLALQDLNYNAVWTYMFFLILLVVLIDLWSNMLRRRLSE